MNVQLGDARVIYVSVCSCIQNKAPKYRGNCAGVQLLLHNCKYLRSYISINMQAGYSDSPKFSFQTVFSYYFCSFCCLSRVFSYKHTNDNVVSLLPDSQQALTLVFIFFMIYDFKCSVSAQLRQYWINKQRKKKKNSAFGLKEAQADARALKPSPPPQKESSSQESKITIVGWHRFDFQPWNVYFLSKYRHQFHWTGVHLIFPEMWLNWCDTWRCGMMSSNVGRHPGKRVPSVLHPIKCNLVQEELRTSSKML